MKNYFKTNTFIVSLIFLSTLSACSAVNPKTSENYDHRIEVNNIEKNNFEQKIAEQCIERETRNSVNKDIDKKRFEKPCLCIASKVMKNLTVDEAEKLFNHQRDTQSLIMNFNQAAYLCLQNQDKPKSPDLFGKK